MTQTNIFSAVLDQASELPAMLRREARDDEEGELVSALLVEVRKWCAKNVDGAAIDARGKLGVEMLGSIAEQGWFGLTIPEKLGGAGLSMKAATRVVAELTRFNGSLGTCVGLHSGLGLFSMIHLAPKGLQERYLPEIAAGKRIAAFAATEPNAGSDIASMRTTLAEEGGKLKLNGSKCYVTNGGLCGLVTVVARSPGLGGARAGHTMVAVDPTWKGVNRQGEEKKLGLKGSSTITIDFEDVEVPADHILGEISKGMDHAHQALTWGRTFMAAGCVGAGVAALEEARAHTAQRVQFGRPIGNFPLVREQTACAMADVYTMESVVRLVCDLYETKHGDIGLDSAIAKVMASEGSWDIVDRCLQLMGGTGYIEEAGMARRMRDMRVTRIFEGANDVLHMHVASSVLGWKPDALKAIPALAPRVNGPHSDAAKGFDLQMQELAERMIATRAKYGFKLFDRQVLQFALAEAMMAVYAQMPVLLRVSRSGDEAEQATALLACARLRERARIWLDRVAAGEDAERSGWVAAMLKE
ncbi:MAG: acyl-CoA dehydrogenase family protein [Deltaproteobacteria bacterium]|nr:acyl-CoA dehydrogenase family protein [Deltaproteobacteria bacterium]